MPTFVDASALTSIIVGEADAEALGQVLDGEPDPLTSAIAVWEAGLAVARIKKVGIDAGWAEVQRLVANGGLTICPIGGPEATAAVTAFSRYGKSRHPARLNMGDCFAYACAKTNGARLLYKGDDFSRTDLA